jgi:hypothetical protein
MTKSDEIARELERLYCHHAEVFNREDDSFFVYYAPIFQIVSSDGGLISVSNDARFWTDYRKALFIEPMLLVTLLVRIVP